MSIAALGPFSIIVNPDANNPDVMHVDIGAESRKDVISGVTAHGETADQFGLRIRGMLRALLNSEPKTVNDPDPEPVPNKRPGRPKGQTNA